MEPITLTNVRKEYGPTSALADVSLRFEPGTVHVLVGPNGSGKTTLFRVLLGLTRPDEGQISVPDVTIGCGFQTPRVYPGLTTGENLSLFAELVDAREEWVETLITDFGLARVRHREAHALSAGFAKRLDIAIALVGEPDVVLLDEPVADIDREYRTRIRGLLGEYVSDERVVILATHRLAEFEPLIDILTILKGGKVIASDSIERLSTDLPAHYAALISE
ncbi:ABC transporter ATP-binding protein [Halapricum desulfuricans]|uniref:ABC-type multidrug transport system, ATPase component n=1 Tax=Halapricum desulfuricans TaxID=2841257 RepID=A0A897NF54_9EURY|nr:ABC transporter ATP-binding protein [Halapricum desulfuricans]QSG09653.1 ABC-type multidrug transport system, ATPase component [Halapricum desulfuricans]